jgi:NAD(P)-dependent dehydrogenase (short-subunit alcohol dehydrogenase family)
MADELFSVKDQIVLVSGGSRGIGRAIAQGFADRGATVVITGRDQETVTKTAQTLGENVCPMVCDVADAAAISALAKAVIDKFGGIDTLVNAAGVNRRKPALEITEDDYDYILDINLKGAFLMSQAVGRHMVERRQGSQINISSLNNERPLIGVIPYAMSKAGMGHMTKVLAMEWGEYGVRVNAIGPGFTMTDLTRKLWSQPKIYEWGMANTPLRRLGQPEDMIGASIFLASKASSFITGQILYVDGGFSAGLIWPIDYGQQ